MKPMGILSLQQNCIGRCLELFEDFSIVIQSVRKGIEVQVNVSPLIIGGRSNMRESICGSTQRYGTREAESVVACFPIGDSVNGG